jgi:hypothetical protein
LPKSVPLETAVPVFRHEISLTPAIQNKTPFSHSGMKQAEFRAHALAAENASACGKRCSPFALNDLRSFTVAAPDCLAYRLRSTESHVSDIRCWPNSLAGKLNLDPRFAPGGRCSQREFCFMTKPSRSCIPTGRDSVPAGSRPHFFIGVQILVGVQV